jgi:leader peptidase (prepilin peptidase) / N-methyltransferase
MESAATRLLATVASGILGLAIGSFLNVVIYRLPRHMSVSRPPSHCPVCDTELSALDNVPVISWLALRGRCRHCGTPISPRYPVVELTTGLLFAELALTLPRVEPIAPLAGVLAASVAIVAIDLDLQEVPPALGWIAFACSLSLAAVSITDHSPGRLAWAGIGAGAAVAAWAIIRVGRRLKQPTTKFPQIASCAAWGWAAGWLAQAGGLTIGLGLMLLAVAGWMIGPPGRRGLISGAGALSIATIVAGAVASR